MFCRQCGIKLPEDARFCTSCGTRVIMPPVAPAAEGPVTAATPVPEAPQQAVPVAEPIQPPIPAPAQPEPPTPAPPEPEPLRFEPVEEEASVVEERPAVEEPLELKQEMPEVQTEESEVVSDAAVQLEDILAADVPEHTEAEEVAPQQDVPGMEPFPTAPPLPEQQPEVPAADAAQIELQSEISAEDASQIELLPEQQQAESQSAAEEVSEPATDEASEPEAPAQPQKKELEFAPPPPPFVESSGEQGAKKEKTTKKKSALGKVLLILFVIIALLLASASGVYYLGVKSYIQLPDWVPMPPVTEEEMDTPSEPEDSAEDTEPGDDDAPQEDAPTVIDLSGDSAYNWPDFAHISDYYLFAREEDGYLYFLPNSVEVEVESKLYRFNRETGNIETIVDLADYGEEEYRGGIDTFTLMGDYLYFSSRLEAARSAYFRVPKEGGDVQFLFIQELSYIQPYNGMLYFVFPRQEAYGVYDPAKDVLPALYPLETPAGSAAVLTNFSVNGDMLYYGTYSGGDADYMRIDLVTGDTETILSSQELGAYMLQPVLVDGEVFYVQYDSDEKRSSWMRAQPGAEEAQQILRQNSTGGMVMFMARIRDFFLYQDGNSYYWSPVDNPTDSSVRVTSGWQPFAVTDNWIYFPDKLVPLDERSNPILMSSAVQNLYGGAEEAYQRALELYGDMPAADYAAVEEGAQPPDSTISLTAGSNEVKDSLLDIFREDDEIGLVMAVWALSDQGGVNADAAALQRGISFLFTSASAVDWMEANGNTIPDELVQAIASELLGVNGASLYDLVRAGEVAGMGISGNQLSFLGWDLGDSGLYTIEVLELPKEQGGAMIATLEGEEMNGTKRSYRVICEKNEEYKAFPYRILRVESD